MSPTTQRLALVASAFQQARRFVGPLDASLLGRWLAAELGRGDALERPGPCGELLSQALAPREILHVVSGNTPHAAFQSLLRGLVLGSANHVKIPAAGLPAFEDFVACLPAPLARLVTLTRELPAAWLKSADLAVVFGSDEAVVSLRAQLPAATRLVAHGHRLSIGIVLEPSPDAARLAAADAGEFDQHGCLSLQAVYVAGGPPAACAFAAELAVAMANYETLNPRGPLTPSEAGAIRNAREILRFRTSNGEPAALWESPRDTSWTVVFEADPVLRPSPLNRFLNVHPLPESLAQLGAETRFLSTVAIHPFSHDAALALAELPATRFCPLGRAQQPSLFWHHDGLATLASMVSWRDFG
jgi:hypothetical protein